MVLQSFRGISFLFFFLIFSVIYCSSSAFSLQDPTPAPWPPQFHSILMINRSGSLHNTDLWYDWPNGRNFNIIQYQLGDLLYDLEWNNGTSFHYILDSNREYCEVVHVPVGILTPNWLDGANYLGQRYIDNFLCNVWEKVDFIWYYEDVVSKRPVSWTFYTGMVTHVITFEVGEVLEDEKWQAPVYCFNQENKAFTSLQLQSMATAKHDHLRSRFMKSVLNN